MTFEEFENLTRLYVVGALDEDETLGFQLARAEFGDQAELCIRECRNLNSMFALSLRPEKPRPETRQKLIEMVRMMREHSGYN
jgi:hypothetical protein